MKVDEGEIVGGFPRAYDAVMEPQSETPIQRSIAASTGLPRGRSVTVDATLPDGRTWSRSYSASFSDELPDCLFSTPNPYVVGVRVRGTLFLIDVANPDGPEEFDVLPVSCAASDVEHGRMFFASDTEVYGFDGVRILWTSRRVSLDGIRDLDYAEGRVRGTATDVGIDAVPFTIDALTGEAEGGFKGWGVVGK